MAFWQLFNHGKFKRYFQYWPTITTFSHVPKQNRQYSSARTSQAWGNLAGGGESEEGITLYQEKEKIYSAIAARGSQQLFFTSFFLQSCYFFWCCSGGLYRAGSSPCSCLSREYKVGQDGKESQCSTPLYYSAKWPIFKETLSKFLELILLPLTLLQWNFPLFLLKKKKGWMMQFPFVSSCAFTKR